MGFGFFHSRSLKMSKRVGTIFGGQLLLLRSQSAVSRKGSRVTLFTSLRFTKTLLTSSLVFQISAGMRSTSLVPSAYSHSRITGITSPPMFLKESS